jgi:hypothetical protein
MSNLHGFRAAFIAPFTPPLSPRSIPRFIACFSTRSTAPSTVRSTPPFTPRSAQRTPRSLPAALGLALLLGVASSLAAAPAAAAEDALAAASPASTAAAASSSSSSSHSTFPPGWPGAGNAQLFHIALIVADNASSAPAPRLPKGAQKALEDIQGFLPYKYYRLADAAVVRGADGGAHVNLRGPDGERYQATFAYRNRWEGAGGEVKFNLAEDPLSEAAAKAAGRTASAGIDTRPLATTFSIKLGETVVVGSSALQGSDRALIVLFTAMPPAATPAPGQ